MYEIYLLLKVYYFIAFYTAVLTCLRVVDYQHCNTVLTLVKSSVVLVLPGCPTASVCAWPSL